jgi:opacity protein-like surface antigen
MQHLKHCLTISLVCMATNLSAQTMPVDNTGWYVGGFFGNQSSDIEKTSRTISDSHYTFGALAGYHFTPWFGLESTLFTNNQDASKSSALRSTGTIGVTFTPKVTWEINNRLSVYAKAGLSSLAYYEEYRSDRRFDEDDTDTWRGVGSTYGVGANLSLSANTWLRLSYDKHQARVDDADNKLSDIDLDLAQTSVGLYYQF